MRWWRGRFVRSPSTCKQPGTYPGSSPRTGAGAKPVPNAKSIAYADTNSYPHSNAASTSASTSASASASASGIM